MNTLYPKNVDDWQNWLSDNHDTDNGVWLIINKKASNNVNITWSQAVDVALCYGWIDSVKKRIDDISYQQFFSKRKRKSGWSKVNKEKIKKLLAENKIKPAGLKSIEIAKQNGSWSLLDIVENLEIPIDLTQALKNDETAKSFYENLSKSRKKQILYWITSAKKLNTKKDRIDLLIKNLHFEQLPKQIN